MNKGQSKIDWDKIDPFLGYLTTLELTEKFGITIGRLAYRRKILGIEAVKRRRRVSGYRKKKSKINWGEIDPHIGVLSDQQIGDKFGIKRRTVAKRRSGLGVQPSGFRKPSHTQFANEINWEPIIKDFGVISDSKIAKRHGISVGSVCLKRKALNISPLHEWHSKGRKMEQWHKDIISKSHKGNTHNLGKKQSKESVAKRMAAMVGVNARCKYYQTAAGLVQGTYELGYIKHLQSEGRDLPVKCTMPIDTPYGMYLPDFEFKDRYIEIKSNYTFDICIGKRFWGESDKKKHFQMKKINFVREYIKPVQVIVLNKKSHGEYSKFI